MPTIRRALKQDVLMPTVKVAARVPFLAIRKRQVRRALESGHPVRVALGSHELVRDGWIATDLQPRKPGTLLVDLLDPLPFPDGSVDAFHAEHVIEHIGFEAACGLVGECFRALHPGGVLRVATPDADRYLNLQAVVDSDLPSAAGDAEEWRRYVVESNRRNEVPADWETEPLLAINRMFNGHGHRFVFNQQTLDRLLRDAGFKPEWQEVCRSRFDHLADLERHGEQIGELGNRLQTMVVDAVKP